MNGFPRHLRAGRKGLLQGLEIVLVALFAALLLDVLWGVFSRYVLQAQSRWTEELAIYLLVWVSLLGAGVTYGERGHLGVDFFVGWLHPAARRLAAILAEVMVLIFAGVVLLFGGGVMVIETLRAGQTTAAMGIPVGYLYAAVPLSGFFFAIFSVENLLELVAGAPAETPPKPDREVG